MVGVPGKVAGEEVVKAVVVPSDAVEERELIALLPGAAGQLQGAAGRGVPRGDPEEPAREDPAQVPDLRFAAAAKPALLWKSPGPPPPDLIVDRREPTQ